jgi:hypothetical protein
MKIAESPDFLESIALHPRVWPSLARAGVDRPHMRELWPYSVGIEFDTGGWWMLNLLDGRWEVHTLFLPKSRDLREKAAQVRRLMFCGIGARELVTKVPTDLPHARRLAEAMGFRHRFTRPRAWERPDGSLVDVDYLGLTRDEWVLQDPQLREWGAEFHRALHAGGFEQEHEDEDVHDAFAGLAVACARMDKPERGVEFYNQWARFAGFMPLQWDGGRAVFNDVAVRIDGASIIVEKR